jgi:hypothetical protein
MRKKGQLRPIIATKNSQKYTKCSDFSVPFLNNLAVCYYGGALVISRALLFQGRTAGTLHDNYSKPIEVQHRRLARVDE